MTVTRYKPLFSVSASYELATTGVSSDGITVEPVRDSDSKMYNLKLKPQYVKNKVTVFYEGIEKPVDAPVTSEPSVEINTNEFFYFSISLSDKKKIKGLKLHSTNAVAKEIGFPLLQDASVKVLGGAATIDNREDVKVILPVFTFTAKASDTGISADYASLEIRNESNVLVDLDVEPVQLNDKAIDGPLAVPEFAFSIDASKLDAGIYEFKVGNYKKKFFVAGSMDLSNLVSIIRVLKNNFLEYKKPLADTSFVQFDIKYPKA